MEGLPSGNASPVADQVARPGWWCGAASVGLETESREDIGTASGPNLSQVHKTFQSWAALFRSQSLQTKSFSAGRRLSQWSLPRPTVPLAAILSTGLLHLRSLRPYQERLQSPGCHLSPSIYQPCDCRGFF